MTTLKVIATGSKGNAYLIDTDGEMLLLDCGVSEKDILRAVDFNLLAINAVLVTHEHTDHAQSVKKLKGRCLKVIGPDSIEGVTTVEPLVLYRINEYLFMPFDVPHDDVKNYGYFIILPNGETLLYATDYSYIPFTFDRPINHFLIECNFMLNDLDKGEEKYGHVIRGHASLYTVKRYLHRCVSEQTKSITLCHTTAFTDKTAMRESVQRDYPGVTVNIAKAGEEYTL